MYVFLSYFLLVVFVFPCSWINAAHLGSVSRPSKYSQMFSSCLTSKLASSWAQVAWSLHFFVSIDAFLHFIFMTSWHMICIRISVGRPLEYSASETSWFGKFEDRMVWFLLPGTYTTLSSLVINVNQPLHLSSIHEFSMDLIISSSV